MMVTRQRKHATKRKLKKKFYESTRAISRNRSYKSKVPNIAQTDDNQLQPSNMPKIFTRSSLGTFLAAKRILRIAFKFKRFC